MGDLVEASTDLPPTLVDPQENITDIVVKNEEVISSNVASDTTSMKQDGGKSRCCKSRCGHP